MKYRICVDLFDEFEKKVKRIIKKCEKHGNPFVYKIVGNEDVKIDGKLYNFVVVDVEGTAKIDDWEFIATLEHNDNGNIIRRYNNEIDIPMRFRTSDNVCEHCNTKRNRSELFIIHNVNTNDWKQVGRNCLQLYTNGLNAEFVASYMDGIAQLERYDYYVNESCQVHVTPFEVIGFAKNVIDKIGYRNSNNDIPTKLFVTFLISLSPSEATKRINDILKEDVFTENDFSIDKNVVNDIIDYYMNANIDSEFMHNVKSLLSQETINVKNIGYLCYLPFGYDKHLEHEKNKASIVANDGHFGTIGERFKNIKVNSIKVLTSFDTIYGITYVCRVILEDNRSFIWKGRGICEDKEIDTASFTIKEHGEYNGVKQTLITNCRIKYKEAC